MASEKVAKLRERILALISVGSPTEALEVELQAALKEERSTMSRSTELRRLSAIAGRRKMQNAAAERIVSQVTEQAAAIDSFLRERDNLAAGVKALVDQLDGLQEIQRSCFEGWGRPGSFQDDTRKVPGNYLPPGLTCLFLVNDKCPGAEITDLVNHYLGLAHAVLSKSAAMEVRATPGAAEADDGAEPDVQPASNLAAANE